MELVTITLALIALAAFITVLWDKHRQAQRRHDRQTALRIIRHLDATYRPSL